MWQIMEEGIERLRIGYARWIYYARLGYPEDDYAAGGHYLPKQ